jgi:hypothetical protein
MVGSQYGGQQASSESRTTHHHGRIELERWAGLSCFAACFPSISGRKTGRIVPRIERGIKGKSQDSSRQSFLGIVGQLADGNIFLVQV